MVDAGVERGCPRRIAKVMPMMDPSLIEIVTRVVANARQAGLEVEFQRDAAVAALWAVMPGEAPAIAHFIVQLAFPQVVDLAA